MTPLTLTNVRNHAGFAAYCAQNCARLSEAEHQCKDAAEKATKLQAICDTAFVTRDASQTQANELAAQLTGMRADHHGDGATRLFNEVLDAGGLEEKVTLATVRAREAGVLAVLAGALEYHRGHRYPCLDVEAHKANCALLAAMAEMHCWHTVIAGFKRHIAAAALGEVDGIVSFPEQGGRVNELRRVASEAQGRHADAVAGLEAAEKRLRESRGN